MELDYLRAFYPQPVILLGRQLLPFSLGHLMLMRSIGNKFVTPEGTATIADLISGICICSRRYRSASQLLKKRFLSLRLAYWGWRCRKANWQEKFQVFAQYIERGSTFPQMPDAPAEARLPGAPLIQRVRITLQGKLGFSFAEAMDYPWGAALFDYFAAAELDGRAHITNDEEEATMEEHAASFEDFDRLVKEGKLNGIVGGDQTWVSFPS